MEGGLGENHARQLRSETAQAKADRIVAQDLRRLGWRAKNDRNARKMNEIRKNTWFDPAPRPPSATPLPFSKERGHCRSQTQHVLRQPTGPRIRILALDDLPKTTFGVQWQDTSPRFRNNSGKRLSRWPHGGIWAEFRRASEQNSAAQPSYAIYPIFTLWIGVRYVPLRAAAFEILRKCAIFLRKKGVLSILTARPLNFSKVIWGHIRSCPRSAHVKCLWNFYKFFTGL